jgi:mannose/fructose/N-acetylgalactosamine-specific phosphotransferase system component IIC
MAPPVVAPFLDVLPIVFLPLKFGCLNVGVIYGVLVTHGVVGSTLTVTWIGVMPSVPALGPHVFLSYVACMISSIFSTSQISSHSSSSLSNPSLSAMTLFLLFILYW